MEIVEEAEGEEVAIVKSKENAVKIIFPTQAVFISLVLGVEKNHFFLRFLLSSSLSLSHFTPPFTYCLITSVFFLHYVTVFSLTHSAGTFSVFHYFNHLQ